MRNTLQPQAIADSGKRQQRDVFAEGASAQAAPLSWML